MLADSLSISALLDWLLNRLGCRRPSAPIKERRVVPRRQIRFPARIQSGNGCFHAMGMDLHDQGAMLVSKQAWAQGTVLFLDLKCFWLMGFAEVRHCTMRNDRNYAIGLQFRAPLMRQELGTWQIERVSHQADEGLKADPVGFESDGCRRAA